MITERHTILSSNLDQTMEIGVYGHFGFSILLFPTITDDPYENETYGMISALSKYITKGKLRVFSVGNVNFQTWLDPFKSNEERSHRHYQYNSFIVEEIVPFIFGHCGGPVPIITCGAAIGAYHAVNTYFRRPDIFYGTIGMSGTYNIEHYTQGFYDSNCYFNSPIHYLPNLTDPYWLSFLQSKHHVYLLTGRGNEEFPENTINLSEVLNNKEISNHLEVWSPEWDHSFNTWNAMLQHILETRL